MTRPTIKIHNVDTDEIIERDMSDDEFAQFKIDSSETKAKSDQDAAKETAKASALAKLATLGLTADEINGLIS